MSSHRYKNKNKGSENEGKESANSFHSVFRMSKRVREGECSKIRHEAQVFRTFSRCALYRRLLYPEWCVRLIFPSPRLADSEINVLGALYATPFILLRVAGIVLFGFCHLCMTAADRCPFLEGSVRCRTVRFLHLFFAPT